MKTNQFLGLILSVLLVGAFSSCGKKNDPIPVVVIPDDSVVINDFSASLKGSEYYIIALDGTTASSLGAKVVADFRTDDQTKFLYFWDNTFTGGTASGPNFYDEVEGWPSFVVGSVGWSGAGFTVGAGADLDKLKAVTDNPDKYFLHIGIKSKSKVPFMFILGGQSEAKFVLGSTGFVDNGKTTAPIKDFTRDGMWQEIEIPMTQIKDLGLLYGTGTPGINILAILAGGIAGTTLDIDAVFIYKK